MSYDAAADKKGMEAQVPYLCLLAAPRVPMTRSLTELALMFGMAPEEVLEEKRQEILAIKNPEWGPEAMAHIFNSRLSKDVELDAQSWWWIVTQCIKPGDAVMWAYSISVLAWLREGQKITYDDLVTNANLFAYGVPELWEDDRDANGNCNEVIQIWDAQKRVSFPPGTSDNMLDTAEFWEMNRTYFWGKGFAEIPHASAMAGV